MSTELGVIEGYYGKVWTWAEREAEVAFLGRRGYRFWLYAPKADLFLRRRWREIHPKAEAEHLARLAALCARNDVRFGVGLSPYEIYKNFDAAAQKALTGKLAFLDDVGVEELGIFFDDMPGDQADLAETQVRIVDWIADRTKAIKITVCPTYYTDDPLIERASGRRPTRYLEDLGAGLDPAVAVFWTGEEVCSREFSPGHLARVSDQLARKPVLWDNYPVNDGPLMSPFLHLRAFTGRPASIGEHIAGHAINPALQPVLSRIPALTLVESYRLGGDYQYGRAWDRAAATVLGHDLARMVLGNLYTFQNFGLDRIDNVARLRERYAKVDHPGAQEIVAWLDGAYRITREVIEAQ